MTCHQFAQIRLHYPAPSQTRGFWTKEETPSPLATQPTTRSKISGPTRIVTRSRSKQELHTEGGLSSFKETKDGLQTKKDAQRKKGIQTQKTKVKDSAITGHDETVNSRGASAQKGKKVVKQVVKQVVEHADKDSHLDLSASTNVDVSANIDLSANESGDSCSDSDPLNECPCEIKNVPTKWIACSKCKQWWHIKCAGINASEFNKLKQSYYKCVLCVLNLIGQSDEAQALKRKLAFAITVKEGEKTEITPTKGKTDDIGKQTANCLKNSTKTGQNIVILDNINTPSQYKDSGKILKEIKNQKPTLNVNFAYILSAGGVALHCKTAEDKTLALEPWPSASFGNSDIEAHEPAGGKHKPAIVCRNIPRHMTDEEIKEAAEEFTGKKCTVRRFKNHRTDSYMPIAKLELCSQSAAQLLVEKGIIVGRKVLPCEPSIKNSVIRCYNCNEYGHTQKCCKNVLSCTDCGQNHNTLYCSNVKYCRNCKVAGHSADSKRCPTYRRLSTLLSNRYNLRENEAAAIECEVLRNL